MIRFLGVAVMLVVLVEARRCGAEEWPTKVREILGKTQQEVAEIQAKADEQLKAKYREEMGEVYNQFTKVNFPETRVYANWCREAISKIKNNNPKMMQLGVDYALSYRPPQSIAGRTFQGLPDKMVENLTRLKQAIPVIQQQADTAVLPKLQQLKLDLQTASTELFPSAEDPQAVPLRRLIAQLPLQPPRLADKLRAISPLTHYLPIHPEAQPVETLPLSALKLPMPELVKQPMQVTQREVDGLKVTELRPPKQFGSLQYHPYWTPQADGFYALWFDKTVRKINLKTMTLERQLPLGQSCINMTSSREGLLVSLDELQEVWLLSHDTLAVKHRFAIPGCMRVLSAPGMDIAFALSTGRSAHEASSFLTVLDLSQKKAVHRFPVPVALSRITPDGKYYVTMHGPTRMLVYRIVDQHVVLHQTNDEIPYNPRFSEVCVSSDSKKVWYSLDSGAAIYSLDNLHLPQAVLAYDQDTSLVDFSPDGQRAYVISSEYGLKIETPTGQILSEHFFPPGKFGGGSPYNLLIHSSQQQLLISMGNQIFLVELPKK